MLAINRTNNIIHYSNKPYEIQSFKNNASAREAYLNMNKSVYVDYVDGDISLPKLLATKLKNFWNIVFKKDPLLEIKAQIIEESLKANAQKGLNLNQQA